MFLKHFHLPSEKNFRTVSLVLLVIYVLLLQLPLLSPFRQIPVDEMQLVDAAYNVAAGKSRVPAGYSWAHIIPETGIFFAAYPPAYMYLLALALKIGGLTPVATGVLHALLRVTAAALFFAICRKFTGVVISSFFTGVWATFATGPVGRYEDLALIGLLLSLYFLFDSEEAPHRLWLAGIFLGFVFLVYPSPLGVLVPLAFGVLFDLQRFSITTDTIMRMIKKYLKILLIALLIAATWLFWIIPYWHEFRVIFLEFAVPDALAPSYLASLGDLVRYITEGFLTSPFPFHFSLLPLIGLVGLLIVLDARYHGMSLSTGFYVSMPLVISLLTARLRIHKTYNLIWIITTILVLLPILWGKVSPKLWRSGGTQAFRSAVIVLLIVVGVQCFLTLALVGLDVVGSVAGVSQCGTTPHADILSSVPEGEKVLTNIPFVFYKIRLRNPVYWPAGLSGLTPGLIPFSTTYDESFRWLILPYSLDEENILEENPGAKFRWDEATLEYFRSNYELIMKNDLRETCNINEGLSRFSDIPRSIYIYRRK